MQNGGDIRINNQTAFQLRELAELDVQQFFQSIMSGGGTQGTPEREEEQVRTGYELGKSEIINEESNEEDESESKHTSSYKKGPRNGRVANMKQK